MSPSEPKTPDEQSQESKGSKVVPLLKELEIVLAKLAPHKKKLGSLEETWERNKTLERELSDLRKEHTTLKDSLSRMLLQLEEHRQGSDGDRKKAADSEAELGKKIPPSSNPYSPVPTRHLGQYQS
jgi:predicted  nucleic acid-binding Zn-ribbon protein